MITKKENDNGIIEIRGYKVWNKSDVVKPYILEHLKNEYPNSLIIKEINRVDFFVLEENAPVEIQSTCTHYKNNRKNKYNIDHREFEISIHEQIEENIQNHDKCIFFFDAEYYRYLNELTRKTCICLNLGWLAKYVKDEKLKIFIVRYDGLIKKLEYNDLEFIRKLSNTCDVEYDIDERILNRNKFKVFNGVLKGYGFTQDDIDEIYTILDIKRDKKGDSISTTLHKIDDEKKRLYGYIVWSLGRLNSINKILSNEKNIQNPNFIHKYSAKYAAGSLGIFDVYGNGSGSHTTFIDKFDICQYFPGYLRNKEKWDLLKGQDLKLECNVAEKLLHEMFGNIERVKHENLGFNFICSKDCKFYKINIKGAHLCETKWLSKQWGYAINKNKATDYFLLFAFDAKGNLMRIWLIPGNDIIRGRKFNEFVGINIKNTKAVIKEFEKYELKDKLERGIRLCNEFKALNLTISPV